MNIFVIWLVLVIAWNFGYPEASPIEDVFVAVILALFNFFKKIFKIIINSLKNIYFDNKLLLSFLNYLYQTL